MNDDTTKDIRVEVPSSFDARGNATKAILHGLRVGIEQLFKSYEEHITKENPVITVKAPDITVNEAINTSPEPVYEDSNIDKSSEE